jgi:mono/diheme cytochrome c family protein
LLKSDVREMQIGTSSPMPSYKDKLDAAELSDVIAYLLSVKGS